eukprot:6490601-Amphidinium_carterae.3
MVSNIGDNYTCNLLEATELNNFRFFAQSCSQVGPARQDSSPSNTTSGLRTLTETRLRMDMVQPQIMHMKIATVVSNLKGNIAENLMMRINQATTFDDVHQGTSNYFNSTCTGKEGDQKGQVGGVSSYDNENYDNEGYNEEEYEENWDYDNNDPVTSAFMKGKARPRGQRKGKGKIWKGDNKGKESRTNKGKNGKGQSKGPQSSYYSQSAYGQAACRGYPQSPPYQQQYYPQPSTPQYQPSTPQQYPKGYSKGYGKQWNKGGKKGHSVPVHQINDNEIYYFEEDPYYWDISWSQDWHLPDGNQQWSGQEVGQVLQQQPSGDNSDTTLPIVSSLCEIGSLEAVGYNGYNDYSGSNDIRLDRQSPRHLKDVWSIIIDTGAAVSICPMTFYENIEVTTMPESAGRQFVTVTR